MKQFVKIIKMISQIDLVKIFSLNAISTVVKMLTNLISLKIVAYMIGPSGVALLGQLTNVSSIVLAFANGGITNGITKYVAEYDDKNSNLKKTLSTALKITLISSAVIGFLLILFSKYISLTILYSEEYYYIFIIFGLTITFYALNLLLISVINGLKNFRLYVIVSIFGSLISLITSIILVYSFGLVGALINAVVFQSVVFVATLLLCRKEFWLKYEYFKDNVDKKMAKMLFGFSLMAITTTVLLPSAQLIIRDRVIQKLSIEYAGWWEGMNRISTMYLYIIMTAFSVYYLPKLSGTKSNYLVRHEIKKCAIFLTPIVLISFVSIYFGRFFVIQTLFTESFLPMQELFVWQLLGDSIKVFSWLFSYLLISKVCVKRFIFTEIVSTSFYLLLSLYMIDNNGILGLVQAYFIKCCLYFTLMSVTSRTFWN